MKTVQYFSDEYLEHSRRLTPDQTVEFLEQFREMQTPAPRSRLISMKVPEPLLNAFKLRCRAEGLRYQTQIKELMRLWLGSPR
ncbi:MAG: CopG family antitoxin [Planctomycetota bacterium]